MTNPDNGRSQLSWKESVPVFLDHDLNGHNLESWMRAVDIVSAGNIPGTSYEHQFLTNSFLITPREMNQHLVVGALHVAREHNMFNSPEIDESVAEHVGRALATAMIWAHKSFPRTTDVYQEQIMHAIAKGQSKLKDPQDIVRYQLRLWQLVNLGLDTFPKKTYKEMAPKKAWFSKFFLSSLIMENARSEFGGDLDVTSRLVDAALNDQFDHAAGAFKMAAVNIFSTPVPEQWNIQPHKMKEVTHAWKQQIARMATTIAGRMTGPEWHMDFLFPMLRALDYRSEDVRADIVNYIISRSGGKKDEFEHLVTGQLFVGDNQRTGILLLRGYKAFDPSVVDLIRRVREIQTRDVHEEIMILFAWWDSQGYEVRTSIKDLLDGYARPSGGPYSQIVHYMPRMMSVEGGLSVVRHGLASDQAYRREDATIGLLTAVDVWNRKGMLAGKMTEVEELLDECHDQIAPDRKSDIQAVLYGYDKGIGKE